MPATVTLSTTTLAAPTGPSDREVKVVSTSGITPGIHLYVEGELMFVVSLGVGTLVDVLRGRDGTAGARHEGGSTVYIGRADQFYSQDPVGIPPAAVLVSPWINATNGTIWFAQGDALPSATSRRWWQKQTATFDIGPLGVRTTILSPTSST
jgi:hypothetical protein